MPLTVFAAKMNIFHVQFSRGSVRIKSRVFDTFFNAICRIFSVCVCVLRATCSI